MAVRVRYNSWCISLPSSAKQQREMTKFSGAYETWRTPANFRVVYQKISCLKMNYVSTVSVGNFFFNLAI